MLESFLDLPDEWEEEDSVGKHQERVALCYAFLAEDVGGAVVVVEEEGRVVPVTVEGESSARWLLVSHRPKHTGTVAFIEGVAGLD